MIDYRQICLTVTGHPEVWCKVDEMLETSRSKAWVLLIYCVLFDKILKWLCCILQFISAEFVFDAFVSNYLYKGYHLWRNSMAVDHLFYFNFINNSGVLTMHMVYCCVIIIGRCVKYFVK